MCIRDRVGTPLIYGEGLESIRELKKIAGDKASIMVDFKIRTNVYDIFLLSLIHI